MAVGKTNRLSKVAREFNVGIHTIVEFLQKKGFDVELNPNTKLTGEMYNHLENEYSTDLNVRKKSEALSKQKPQKETISIEDIRKDLDNIPVQDKSKKEEVKVEKVEIPHKEAPKVLGKIDLDNLSKKKKQEEKPTTEAPEAKQPEEKPKKEEKPIEVKEEKPTPEESQKPAAKKNIEEPKVVGKIDIESLKKPKKQHKQEKKEAIHNKEVVSEDKTKAQQEAKPKTEKVSPEKKAEKPSVSADSTQNEKKNSPQEKKEDKSEGLFKPTQVKKLSGPTVVGKIELPTTPSKSDSNADKNKKKKRKRIRKDKERVNINEKSTQQGGGANQQQGGQRPKGPQAGGQRNQNPRNNNDKPNRRQKNAPRRPVKAEISEEDVQKQIKDTLARLTANKGKSKASRHRRDKRDAVSQKHMAEMEKANQEKNIIQVAEFVTVAELATMMDVQVNQIIASCMSLGLFVSINQRLDAETISLVAEEFDHKVEFISVEIAAAIDEEEEIDESLLEERSLLLL